MSINLKALSERQCMQLLEQVLTQTNVILLCDARQDGIQLLASC